MTTPAKPGASRKQGGRGRTAKAGGRARADATGPEQPEAPATQPPEPGGNPKRRPRRGQQPPPAPDPAPETAPAPAAKADSGAEPPDDRPRSDKRSEPSEPAAVTRPPATEPAPAVRPASAPEPSAPVGFDELHRLAAPRLLRQTYLLTGNQQRAAHCVDRAFELAWTHWPEVSADASPEGWLRAVAFDLALSPWHGSPRRLLTRLPSANRLGRKLGPKLGSKLERRLEPKLEPKVAEALTEQDRALVLALLRLPRGHRRVLVLHDVVGLDWKQTSTEAEATTPTAYARTVRARRAMAEAAPGILGADPLARGFGRRLGALLRATAERGCQEREQPARTDALRRRSLLRERSVTAAVGLATLATAVTLLAGALLGTPFHPPAAPFVTYGSLHGKHPQGSPSPQPSGSAAPAVGAGALRPVAAVPQAHARDATLPGRGTQAAPHRYRPGRGSSSSRRARRP